jgi:hypothetical protein
MIETRRRHILRLRKGEGQAIQSQPENRQPGGIKNSLSIRPTLLSSANNQRVRVAGQIMKARGMAAFGKSARKVCRLGFFEAKCFLFGSN